MIKIVLHSVIVLPVNGIIVKMSYSPFSIWGPPGTQILRTCVLENFSPILFWLWPRGETAVLIHHFHPNIFPNQSGHSNHQSFSQNFLFQPSGYSSQLFCHNLSQSQFSPAQSVVTQLPVRGGSGFSGVSWGSLKSRVGWGQLSA